MRKMGSHNIIEESRFLVPFYHNKPKNNSEQTILKIIIILLVYKNSFTK